MADPAVVADLLLARCAALSAILPVAMPDVIFSPPADGKYLRVGYFTNVPRWEGLSDGAVDQGLLQIDVVWPKGQGVVAHRRVVSQVAALFPKGLRLYAPGARVTVNREPWAASPIVEASRTLTPITVSWVA